MNRVSALGARYLPFLVAAALLAALVVVAPSKGTTPVTSSFNGGNGSTAAGPAGDSGAETVGTDTGVTAADGSSSGGRSPGAGGAGARGGGAASGGPGGAGQVSGAIDPAKCGTDGRAKAPYGTNVPCKPTFSGTNAGATMAGVTAQEIRYTIYIPMSNPAISQALDAAGFGDTPEQVCATGNAYEATIQKHFEFYGRHLAAIDGPGKNAGSANTSSCRYNYFQSQCQSLPPEPACARADADVIASQKVGFVIAPLADSALYTQLARRHVIVLGADAAPRQYRDAYAPYWWGVGMAGERILGLASQYYCNRLVGREPQYGGADVVAFPGTRHVGVVFAQNNGDDSSKISADVFLKTVRACGDADAKGYTYTSDVTTAETQATNLVAQLRSDKVTTIACFCDVIAPAFFLKALDQNRYYPEHMTVGITSIASDVVGQLYYAASPDQWVHAFGISNFGINQPDAGLDYRKAYADGGGQGKESTLDVGTWPYILELAQMIHMAGSQLDPTRIYQGMQALPRIAQSKLGPALFYGAPDFFTNARDMAEVWFNPNLKSAYNDKQGAMCYVNHAKRFDLGEFPKGEPALFAQSGPCETL